ncbi:(Lyso)-N-acylphosphatidylethanolamine lipase [Pseudolycoriella hygida]|uniref:(Lyso)-N-acylphosphatidylethanolamine lipase n=1 Tax=Pseudolycoriella hygida TaxID=35572 RepID=A0A9Q0S935_9DIPT|nr:(Lyso)-N-acylphosphatidylethanolamine lipase [Pseudolycoriella hygida]
MMIYLAFVVLFVAFLFYNIDIFGFVSCLFTSYLKWNGHSPLLLEQSETSILSNVKMPYERFPVSIGDCVGAEDKIWTLSMNTESKNVPLVMIHGFAAGIAFWLMNLEELSADRPLYAIDLLGFGRSSRPTFSTDAETIEEQFVDSIDKWRELMKIESMILLGHSFGGFLATSYAMKYSNRVEHLIAADPWGYTGARDLSGDPLWRRSLIKVFQNMAPLAIIRAAGPYGEWLVKKARKDILRKYEKAVEDQNIIAQYIYQCNSGNPSGEEGFRNLLHGGPWAKHPIGDRVLIGMQDDIPITFLYGEKSWMDNKYGEIIKAARPNSYTQIEIVPYAGHHVYSDNALDFNQFVNEACKVLKSKTV